MKENKFYFYGYQKNSQDDDSQQEFFLFASEKATSLYDALKEFEQFEIRNNKKYKVIKILEGAPRPDINKQE